MAKKLKNAEIIEQIFLSGAFSSDLTLEQKREKISNRLNLLTTELGQGWTVEILSGVEDFLKISRMRQGVLTEHVINLNLVSLSEMQGFQNFYQKIADYFAGNCALIHKEISTSLNGPLMLLEEVLNIGKQGVSMQRYKGLGEMNPDQLWETTLDPDARTLLQVKLTHVDQAEEIFSTLMGDVVEPRRIFIQENALNVSYLDA